MFRRKDYCASIFSCLLPLLAHRKQAAVVAACRKDTSMRDWVLPVGHAGAALTTLEAP